MPKHDQDERPGSLAADDVEFIARRLKQLQAEGYATIPSVNSACQASSSAPSPVGKNDPDGFDVVCDQPPRPTGGSRQ